MKKVVLLSQQQDLPMLVEASLTVVAWLNGPEATQSVLPILPDLMSLKHFLAHQEVNAIVVTADSLTLLENWGRGLVATGLPVLMIEGAQIKTIANPSPRSIPLVLKRLGDLALALLGLVAMGLTALIIYPIVQQQSPGPIFFSQKRVGKNGRLFRMYKFRSMYLDADKKKADLLAQNDATSSLIFKLTNDPRIFPFGQVMRQWSIDELPQFINVLKGEMSVVGTRPPLINEYEQYELHHFKRLTMKPGITGPWQVGGRSNIRDFEEVVRLDTAYIDHWSLWLDIKILLKTVQVVLQREGSR